MRRSRTRTAAAALCLAVAAATTACSEPSGGQSNGNQSNGAQPGASPSTDDPRDGSRQVDVTLTQVATAEAPSAGVTGPGETVWVAERPGRVRVLEDGGLSDPVLDITGETTTDGERGLLGITFDEAFAHFYISFTDPAGNTAIDEFEVAGGELHLDTRRTILTQQQPYPNHNGGDLAFGPDGMLYIGLGDGNSGGDPHGHGQNLSTLLATMLRIDPSAGDPYGIPPDNPFVDDPDARAEIWAYGLRNPWRFSFDAETGDLWIADVGQSSLEEVDWAAAGTGAGANYGWSRMEGTQRYSGDAPDNHLPPIFEYDTGERCSITGGYVYRGSAIPDLQGAYLFSDYCEGNLRALDFEDGEVTGQTNLGVNAGAVVSFVQGPDRELYLLDLNGPIYRIDPT